MERRTYGGMKTVFKKIYTRYVEFCVSKPWWVIGGADSNRLPLVLAPV
ncbi:hypothetical protein JW933_08695 [candidate division FCPU426 bacterium]|nr:hypothetical protein [candidate division FCPU426 bacterium]